MHLLGCRAAGSLLHGHPCPSSPSLGPSPISPAEAVLLFPKTRRKVAAVLLLLPLCCTPGCKNSCGWGWGMRKKTAATISLQLAEGSRQGDKTGVNWAGAEGSLSRTLQSHGSTAVSVPTKERALLRGSDWNPGSWGGEPRRCPEWTHYIYSDTRIFLCVCVYIYAYIYIYVHLRMYS